MNAKDQSNSMEKKLCRQLFLSLSLYAAVGLAATLVLDYILTFFQNPISVWLIQRIDLIYFFCLIFGFGGIFYRYWKKPWSYLNEVIQGAGRLHEQDSRPIELSAPLGEVENQMNQIKMSVLLSKQAAKAAEDKKNDLIMYLAHDIRTPLTTVIGYLNLLEEAPDMPAEQRTKYTGIALEKAERLEGLINELFEITRLHARTIALKKEKLDLYCLLVQLADEFYPAISAKGNSLRLEIKEKMTVFADAEKLVRVFSNILKNAVSYSYPATEILITADVQGDFVNVDIQNQGDQIPQDRLGDIFEKFIRLDKARLSDTGGTGLGLSIAEEIIRLHGGEITVESEDKTVIFHVRLPLSD